MCSLIIKCLVTISVVVCDCFFFQAEDGIRDLVRSRGLGDVYKRQHPGSGKRGDPERGDEEFAGDVQNIVCNDNQHADGESAHSALSLIHI